MTTRTTLPLAVIAGLGLATTLAACAPAATPPADTGTTAPKPAASGSAGSGSAGGFADGTYQATGEYQAPSGTESIDVTVTLAGDVVTDITVVGNATDAQAKAYQGQFISGIGEVVVGKKITELQVDRVGGSSLTSGGFNAALETIKADAAQ